MKITASRRKELRTEAVEAVARERGIAVEDVIFGYMKTSPELFGALSDWDDVRNITISVIRELKHYMPYVDIYRTMLRIIDLYDTEVISVLRVYSDVRRLAYFVNEMVECLYETAAYREALAKATGLEPDNRIALRGEILIRITSREVRHVLLCDPGEYFKAEVYCTENRKPGSTGVRDDDF